MKNQDRFGLFLIILFPFFVVSSLQLKPLDNQIRLAWQKVMDLREFSNYGGQIVYLELIQKLEPWQQTYWPYLAEAYYHSERFIEAVEAFEKAAELGLIDLEDQFALADSYWHTGEPEKAMTVWSQIREEDQLDSMQYKRLYEIQRNHEDDFGAYLTLATWLKNDRNTFDLWYPLGLYQMIFEPQVAGETLLHALLDFPQFSAKVREFRSDIDQILSTEDKTYQFILKGQSLARQGEWHYAAVAFKQATELNNEYAEAWAMYGNALNRSGKDGSLAIERAYQLNPESPVVRAMKAYAFQMKGSYTESLNIWQALASENSQEPVWQLEIANSYAAMGNLEDALTHFQSATRLAPENIYYWKQLARFCIEMNYMESTVGLAAARTALSLNPDDGETLDLLGWMFLTLDDLVSAERFLYQAESKLPYSALNKLHLGQLAILQNAPSRAYEYLTESVRFSQNEQITQQAEALLNTLGGY